MQDICLFVCAALGRENIKPHVCHTVRCLHMRSVLIVKTTSNGIISTGIALCGDVVKSLVPGSGPLIGYRFADCRFLRGIVNARHIEPESACDRLICLYHHLKGGSHSLICHRDAVGLPGSQRTRQRIVARRHRGCATVAIDCRHRDSCQLVECRPRRHRAPAVGRRDTGQRAFAVYQIAVNVICCFQFYPISSVQGG